MHVNVRPILPGLTVETGVPYGQGRYSVLPALAWHISRVMIKIEAVRERYRYGTKDARLYRDIAVEEPTWRGRLLDVLLFCVFFNAHGTYKDRLESARLWLSTIVSLYSPQSSWRDRRTG